VLTLARIFQRFELRLDPERHKGPLDLRSSEQRGCCLAWGGAPFLPCAMFWVEQG